MKVEVAVLVALAAVVVNTASAADESQADCLQLQMTPSTRLKEAAAHSMKIQQKPQWQQRRSYNDVLKEYDSSTVPKTYPRSRYKIPPAATKRPPKKKGRVVPATTHRGKHSSRSRLSLTGSLG